MFWWTDKPSERYWVEIRHPPAIGTELHCGLLDSRGHRNGWYELVGAVQPHDIVFHWNVVEQRFVGWSVVASPPTEAANERTVQLRGFTPIRQDVSRAHILSVEAPLTNLRNRLTREHPGATLYLPFQYRKDGIRMMSNYFAKLPSEALAIVFTNLSRPELASADSETPRVRTRFLSPFKPKADSDYLATVAGGQAKRTRAHETLVNEFAVWLEARGFQVGRNAVIDIGIEDPPVIVEAKTMSSPANAIRQAIGQLYEYRFFEVVNPRASLIFLSSIPVEPWVDYLEGDRRIGVAWSQGAGFHLSPLALEILGL